jgi:hypothetical protein
MLIHAADRTVTKLLIDHAPSMERTDLLIAVLALGAAVSSLMAWIWAALAEPDEL